MNLLLLIIVLLILCGGGWGSYYVHNAGWGGPYGGPGIGVIALIIILVLLFSGRL